MALVLLDSTVLIDYLRGRPAAHRVERLAQVGDIPITSAINVEEIVRGLRPGEADDAMSLFLGLGILAIGLPVGYQAGTWRREHARLGVTLSQADCLVAAVAHSVGAILATGNPRHFPMQGVVVDHWPVGQ